MQPTKFKLALQDLRRSVSDFEFNTILQNSIKDSSLSQAQTLMGLACHKGSLEAVKSCLKQYPEVLNLPTDTQKYLSGYWLNCEINGNALTPLMAALASKQYIIAQFLLKIPKIDLSIQCNQKDGGWSALTILSMEAMPTPKARSLITKLMDLGVTPFPDVKNEDKNHEGISVSIVSMAIDSEDWRMVKTVVKHSLFSWDKNQKIYKKGISDSLGNLLDELNMYDNPKAEDLNLFNFAKKLATLLFESNIPPSKEVRELEKRFPEECIQAQRSNLNQNLPRSDLKQEKIKLRL